MRKLAFILALVGAAQPLLAQEQTEDGRTIIRITIYGDDSCPTGTGDEVVVCAPAGIGALSRAAGAAARSAEPGAAQLGRSRAGAGRSHAGTAEPLLGRRSGRLHRLPPTADRGGGGGEGGRAAVNFNARFSPTRSGWACRSPLLPFRRSKDSKALRQAQGERSGCGEGSRPSAAQALFSAAIHSRTWRSSTSSGTLPWSSTASWKRRKSNFGPSVFSASARSSRIRIAPSM